MNEIGRKQPQGMRWWRRLDRGSGRAKRFDRLIMVTASLSSDFNAGQS